LYSFLLTPGNCNFLPARTALYLARRSAALGLGFLLLRSARALPEAHEALTFSAAALSSTAGANMSTVSTSSKAAPMRVIGVRAASISYPTGNKNFSVMQAFPAAVDSEESDPFLMMDHFGPTPSSGAESDPDKFPVQWHPHRGMDIATYMVSGVGRHADSLGNREVFASPGMQFCSVGSGIEHAEAGGTPAGESTEGFQLWLNVPSARKMDPPRYGTVGPDRLPLLSFPGGVTARVLSGTLDAAKGPFETVQPLLMLDVTVPEGASLPLSIAALLDNTMVYCYRGSSLSVNGVALKKHSIGLFDARGAAGERGVELVAAAGGGASSALLFAGKRLNQPIAWHGPFVMTTQAEIRATFAEFQRGAFPPVRAPFDYRTLAAFPADHPARLAGGFATIGSGAAGK
jgi:hypothetical protein